MNLHEICRKKRREINMSQSRLAEYTSIDQAAISKFENGRGGISMKSVQKIIDILEINITTS